MPTPRAARCSGRTGSGRRRSRRFPAAVAILSAALLAAGCTRRASHRNVSRPGAGRDRVPTAAEWLARRAAEAESGNAGPAELSAWTEPAALPGMTVRPLPVPGEKVPEKPGEIVACLSDRKADRRILGLVGAWRRRPPEALPALERIARADDAFSVTAVRVLARYDGPEGARALLACLGSRSAPARTSAAAALASRRIGPGGPAEAALVRAARSDRDWRVRAAAARALGLGTSGRFGREAELTLESLMRDGRSPDPVRLESAAALARADIGSGWDFLGEAALGEADPARAALALRLAGECGGRRGAALLGAALQSGHAGLWTAAVDAFAPVGRADALVALAAMLRGGGEAGRRAALALAPHEGRAVLAELVEAAERGSATVRAAACAALASAVGADAAAALERKLLDAGEVPGVRAAAARALGRVGGPVVAPILQGLAKEDPDEVVRAAAREALALVEARIKAGPGGVSDADAERFAFGRWELKALLPGRPPDGCRLADDYGVERVYRVGDAVAHGYRLSRVFGAGDRVDSAEVIMAGRAATRSDLLRAVLVKGDRSVVLVRQAIAAEK